MPGQRGQGQKCALKCKCFPKRSNKSIYSVKAYKCTPVQPRKAPLLSQQGFGINIETRSALKV